MRKSLLLFTVLGALTFLSATALSSCSSGTKPGDTNVEVGHEKDKDAKAGSAKQGEGHRDNEPGADG